MWRKDQNKTKYPEWLVTIVVIQMRTDEGKDNELGEMEEEINEKIQGKKSYRLGKATADMY